MVPSLRLPPSFPHPYPRRLATGHVSCTTKGCLTPGCGHREEKDPLDQQIGLLFVLVGCGGPYPLGVLCWGGPYPEQHRIALRILRARVLAEMPASDLGVEDWDWEGGGSKEEGKGAGGGGWELE